MKSRYPRGISKIILTSRLWGRQSVMFSGNLRQSVRVTDAWEWQRDASSVLEWSSNQRRRTLMQPLFISSQTPDPLSFQIGKPVHTQACARQLRAAKKTRENNLNILSRWWQTRKRGRIMSRAFSPFPTIPTTMKTIKQNFRTIVQFYFSIPPFLIQKRILSIHNYVTRITTSEKIYSLYFSKESNELSNVTRKPQMIEDDQQNEQQTLDPYIHSNGRHRFIRAKLSTHHPFQEACLQSRAFAWVQLTRSKGYSCFPGRLNNSRGEGGGKKEGAGRRGVGSEERLWRRGAPRRAVNHVDWRFEPTANNNLLEITDNRTRRPRPIMNQGKHSANYRFRPSTFFHPPTNDLSPCIF